MTVINTITQIGRMGGGLMGGMARGGLGDGISSIGMRELVASSPMEFQGGIGGLGMPNGISATFQGGNNAFMRQITNTASARFKMGVDDMSFFGGKGGGIGGGSSGGVGGIGGL